RLAPLARRGQRPRAGARRRRPGPPRRDRPRARRRRRGPPDGGAAGVPPEALMAARGPASREARGASPKKLIGAGYKAYEWLKEALGVYGTAVTVVQLVPAVLALLPVLLTPTA